MQLALPISIETRDTILSAPIVDTYLKEVRGQHFRTEVVGGRFAGTGYVYIIRLERKISRVQFYCGSTDDPARRFREHERTWPKYQFTVADLDALAHEYPVTSGMLRAMQGKIFRRKHTFLAAVTQCLGWHNMEFLLLNTAKKHTANGIIMAANQRGIGWRVARLFQADRSLEFALKRRKQSLARFLPAVDVPF